MWFERMFVFCIYFMYAGNARDIVLESCKFGAFFEKKNSLLLKNNFFMQISYLFTFVFLKNRTRRACNPKTINIISRYIIILCSFYIYNWKNNNIPNSDPLQLLNKLLDQIGWLNLKKNKYNVK